MTRCFSTFCCLMVYLAAVLTHHCSNALSEEDEIVEYYEKLIRRESQEAFHYNLPTSADSYRPKSTSKIEHYGTYDFIIIGAGSAGSVLAGRLSEISKWNVLLLEAGGSETDFSQIPGVYDLLQASRFNWNYNTTKQTHACLGMIDHKCPMPRGRALGGSSAINGMVYYRFNQIDYDNWAAQGNPGWSYKDVLPYFIKSENSQIPNADPGYHGKGGPLNVTYSVPLSKQMSAILEGHRELYNQTSDDYTGKNQLGMFRTQHTTDRQYRLSSFKAFVKPALARENLKVSTYSYVTKILIDENTRSAYGVQFVRSGKMYHALVKKEVILSGGAIGSPQILMLSGIGPKAHLDRHRIPVIQNLPVGKNFADHTIFHGMYVSTNVTEPTLTLREHVEDFMKNRGLLAIASQIEGVGFYQSTHASLPDYPDIELLISTASGAANADPFIKRNIKVTDEIYNALFTRVDYRKSFSAYIYLLNQTSYGQITLQSSDPFAYPLIDLKYLSQPEELEIMYEAVLELEMLLKTDALKSIDAKIFLADYPQCRKFKPGSKSYWKCAFKLLSSSGYHQMSSCRMGPLPMHSVVDYKARVHGIKGLRVADASIIPVMHTGHTHAPTVMIGEKISDQIKLDHGAEIEPINDIL